MSFWSCYPFLENELDLVENEMQDNIRSKNKILTDISKYLISAGGKRLRPAFVIIAAKLGKKYDREVILKIAAAVEMIHTATLVHDDIIDESRYRRGKESVYSKWGRDIAIYSGDYLFTRAFMLLSKNTSYGRMYYVAEGMKAICEGEIDQYQMRYNFEPDIFLYLKRIFRKTAVLFLMSMTVGAYESKCSKTVARALKNYSIGYGIAFQINDDLLDYFTDEEEIGKPIGLDLKRGNYSLPVLFALKDKEYGGQIKELLQKKQKINDVDVNNIIKLVKKTDAINHTKEISKKFLERANTALNDIKHKEINNLLKMLLKEIEKGLI